MLKYKLKHYSKSSYSIVKYPELLKSTASSELKFNKDIKLKYYWLEVPVTVKDYKCHTASYR